jgi:hypothetical protein
MQTFLFNVILIILYIVVMIAGNSVCRIILENRKIENKVKVKESSETQIINPESGWLIGILERLIIGLGVLLHSWEIVAGIIALKSIARYQELDKQINAEYFLIGSMLSILWAFIVTFVFIIFSDYLIANRWLDASFIGYIQSYTMK